MEPVGHYKLGAIEAIRAIGAPLVEQELRAFGHELTVDVRAIEVMISHRAMMLVNDARLHFTRVSGCHGRIQVVKCLCRGAEAADALDRLVVVPSDERLPGHALPHTGRGEKRNAHNEREAPRAHENGPVEVMTRWPRGGRINREM